MPNEPDRYDLDEMMDRLKSRSHADPDHKGELVTRADGSQAIRVRRRKRRSSQPHKERQRRIRMLQVSAVLVIILLAVLAAGFVTIYVNTSPFRGQLIHKVAVVTGADAKLQQFRMNPIGANAQGIDMEWPAGNILESLSLRSLRADVSPLGVLSGRFAGDELAAHSGNLVLRLVDSGKPRRTRPAQAGSPPLSFSQCSVNSMEIQFKNRDTDFFRLTGGEATFEPAQGDRPAMLTLNKGDLLAHNWTRLSLDRAYLEFVDDHAEVLGASFRYPDDERGLLEVSGRVSPYKDGETSSLVLSAQSFLISGLLGDGLGRLFQGRVDSDPDSAAGNHLDLSFDGQADARLALGFRSTLDEPFLVQNLPVLYALSQILGDEWFSMPNFRDSARGRITRTGSNIEIDDLQMQSENRMAIRGSLSFRDGVLGGVLQVGLANGMIQASENRALNEMFGELREGYRWVELDIAGSTAAPQDNFSKLYGEAVNRLKRPAPTTGNPGGSSFDELTRPR